MAPLYNYEYFTVTFPGEYVAQVEINRPEKMNAFNETYVRTCFFDQRHHPLHESFIMLFILPSSIN
jgi:1,4-dihydroxy-2-naphthoyl-CoA synthase